MYNSSSKITHWLQYDTSQPLSQAIHWNNLPKKKRIIRRIKIIILLMEGWQMCWQMCILSVFKEKLYTNIRLNHWHYSILSWLNQKRVKREVRGAFLKKKQSFFFLCTNDSFKSTIGKTLYPWHLYKTKLSSISELQCYRFFFNIYRSYFLGTLCRKSMPQHG